MVKLRASFNFTARGHSVQRGNTFECDPSDAAHFVENGWAELAEGERPLTAAVETPKPRSSRRKRRGAGEDRDRDRGAADAGGDQGLPTPPGDSPLGGDPEEASDDVTETS